MVTPSAAVTTTVMVFDPVRRLKSPVMSSMVASGSTVSTSTNTLSVPAATVMVAPSVTLMPSMAKRLRPVSALDITWTVTV